MSKTAAIILAAGKGTRLNCVDYPKAMHELNGKPMVDYIVDSVEMAGFSPERICIIVGFHKEKITDYFKERVHYEVQEQQLGTGHAVAMAETYLKGRVDEVVVLYGDMPFVTTESIERLVERHRERDNTVTLMTVTVPEFEGNYMPFYSFGRIVRTPQSGFIEKIVEKKDCTPEELLIREVNPAYFCFKASWLWDHVKQLDNHNVQKEYYLVDLVRIAIEEGENISSIDIAPREAIGINTVEDAALAEVVLQKLED